MGGIRTAVERALQQRPAGYHVEVEITSLEELEDAIQAGADGVLLDNMTPAEVRECVQRAAGRVRLEVSGASTQVIFAPTRRPASIIFPSAPSPILPPRWISTFALHRFRCQVPGVR